MALQKKRNSLNKRVKDNKKRKSRLNNSRKSKKGGADGADMDVPSGAKARPDSKSAFNAHLEFIFPEMEARQKKARSESMKLESFIKKLNDSGITIDESEDVSALYTTLKAEHLNRPDDPKLTPTNDLTQISEYFINATVSGSSEKRFPKSAEILEKINNAKNINTEGKANLFTDFFLIFLASDPV